MQRFQYIRPETIQETLELLAETPDGETKPLAGGTDLLTLMKEDIEAPARLVDVKRLQDLPRGIAESDAGVTVGALTTLSEIESDPLLQDRYSLLCKAAEVAATPQLRNMATVGGNLLQRPRCWYFRNHIVDCWLKGGDDCPAYHGQNQRHALFGDGPCYAVHPSDLAPALLALEARVRLRGPQGERTLPLSNFFALPEVGRRRETIIEGDELLVSIELPALSPETGSSYLKAMERKVWDFALVSVAAIVRLEGELIADARLVLGGVAPIPWHLAQAQEELQGGAPDPQRFARAADAALAGARPLTHNGYKISLLRNLIPQALAQATEQIKSFK